MEFEKIAGYDKLTTAQKLIFQDVFKAHQESMSKLLRKGYTPVKVEWTGTLFNVTFKNGIWLHYTAKGGWY